MERKDSHLDDLSSKELDQVFKDRVEKTIREFLSDWFAKLTDKEKHFIVHELYMLESTTYLKDLFLERLSTKRSENSELKYKVGDLEDKVDTLDKHLTDQLLDNLFSDSEE